MTEDKNSKPDRVRTRRLLYIAAAVLVVAAALRFILAPRPVAVETVRAVEGPMQVSVSNEGQVRVRDRYVVAAPATGALERIALREGDPVKRGQTVAMLTPAPLDPRQREEALARLESARATERQAAAGVERAQSDLELAVSELGRTRGLAAENFISRQAVQKADSAERSARAEREAAGLRQRAAQADVQAAQAALAAADLPPGSERRVALTSPVDGYVVAVTEKSARTVPAGTPLVTIGDPARYEVVVDVLSTDAVKIPPAAPMLLEGWGGGRTLQARVRLVEPVAFTKVSALGVEEQRVNVLGDPVDPLGPLGDGYRIEGRIVIWSADKVLKLPGSSLFRGGDAWRVFVVENGRAHERMVQVGQRNQDEAQILAGLSAGTVVVRFPGNELRDGTRVQPREKEQE